MTGQQRCAGAVLPGRRLAHVDARTGRVVRLDRPLERGSGVDGVLACVDGHGDHQPLPAMPNRDSRGSAGSAKSSTLATLIDILDPRAGAQVGEPGSEDNLVVTAYHSAVMSFDNVETLVRPKAYMDDEEFRAYRTANMTQWRCVLCSLVSRVLADGHSVKQTSSRFGMFSRAGECIARAPGRPDGWFGHA